MTYSTGGSWAAAEATGPRRPGPVGNTLLQGNRTRLPSGRHGGRRGGAGRRGRPHEHRGAGAHWGRGGLGGQAARGDEVGSWGGPVGAAPGGQLRLPPRPLPAASPPGRTGRPDPAGYVPRSWVQVSTSQGAHGGLSRVMREALAWEGTAPLALPGRCPQRPWARSALGTGASLPPLSAVPTERHVRVLGTRLDAVLGACSAPAGSHTSRGLCGQQDRWAEEGGGLPGVHHPPGLPR